MLRILFLIFVDERRKSFHHSFKKFRSWCGFSQVLSTSSFDRIKRGIKFAENFSCKIRGVYVSPWFWRVRALMQISNIFTVRNRLIRQGIYPSNYFILITYISRYDINRWWSGKKLWRKALWCASASYQ